ncbi:MAG TPA: serine hydrolase domain-containing protein [Polyangiaceae bacterium]
MMARLSWLPSRLRPAMHVRVFPPEEVTSRNVAAEAEPGAAGLSGEDVDAIWGSVVRLYETGLHPAIALCVRRRGLVVLDRAIGHLRGNSPEDGPDTARIPVRHDSLFNFFSASKAVTAMVVHLLDERGLIHLDDAVVEYFPEFGRHGKDAITIRQLLTHRAGIPAVPGTRIDLGLLTDPQRLLDVLCDAKPLSVPGRRLAYHALTSGFVLGEIVRRVTGRDIRRVLREEVLAPLGFAAFGYGVSADAVDAVARNAFTGLPAFPPQSWALERALGLSAREATEMSNDPRFLTAVVPSGNVIGTAAEASRFFQLLLDEGELDGVRVFARRTVRRAVREQSHLEIDSFLGMPVRYAMGFMLGGDSFSPYGAHTSRAYGHVGFTNVVAWADPQREISVGLMTSGKPFITPGQIAWLGVARTISRRCGG